MKQNSTLMKKRSNLARLLSRRDEWKREIGLGTAYSKEVLEAHCREQSLESPGSNHIARNTRYVFEPVYKLSSGVKK